MNITYLLGAGASIGAIPVYTNPQSKITFKEDFLDILAEILNLLDNNRNRPYTHTNGDEAHPDIIEDINKMKTLFKQDLESLKEEIDFHPTVDTLAKKLYLMEDDRINVLKALLSLYFLFKEQHSIDKRYDTFLSAILEKNHVNDGRINAKVKMPSNIKIISWNYDRQLEKAFGNYADYRSQRNKNDLLLSHEDLKVFPRLDYNPQKKSLVQSDDINLLKLNGTAIYYPTGSEDFEIYDDNLDADFTAFENYYRYMFAYSECRKKTNTIFNFSWEENSISTHAINIAKKIISETDSLVIIGYSFPFFNKSVDTEILNQIDTSRIRKIIFQDKTPGKIKELFSFRCKRLTQAVILSENIELIESNYTDQFILPED